MALLYSRGGDVGHGQRTGAYAVIMGLATRPPARAPLSLQPLQPRTRYPTPDIGSHRVRSPCEILLPYGDVCVLSDLGFFMV